MIFGTAGVYSQLNQELQGLWQVMGRSRTTFDEMVRLDLKYLREWSLWLDLKILLMTPKAVISGSGAFNFSNHVNFAVSMSYGNIYFKGVFVYVAYGCDRIWVLGPEYCQELQYG